MMEKFLKMCENLNEFILLYNEQLTEFKMIRKEIEESAIKKQNDVCQIDSGCSSSSSSSSLSPLATTKKTSTKSTTKTTATKKTRKSIKYK